MRMYAFVETDVNEFELYHKDVKLLEVIPESIMLLKEGFRPSIKRFDLKTKPGKYKKHIVWM